MKGRLLLVSEPGRDGVFVFVQHFIRHLHARHPETAVDLAYSRQRGGEALAGLVKEVEAHGGETLDLGVTSRPQFLDGPAWVKLVRMVARRNPRLVHAHSSKAGGLCRLARLLPGFPPVLYSPHAYFGMSSAGGTKERLYNAIESMLGRIGQTHNCSEDERDFARDVLGLNPRSLHVIHHGVDTDRFAPAGPLEKTASRRRLGLPEHGRLLVTVGRDSEQKNYAPLYATLRDFLPASETVFAHAGWGAEELRGNLPSSARARAFAFRHIEHPEILLRAADGFILTSRYEGLSFSMLEALSCGLPLLLTKAPGLGVLRTLGFRGVRWLPNPAAKEDITRELAAALESWAAGPVGGLEEQRKMACQLFTESRQMEKIVNLYELMLK